MSSSVRSTGISGAAAMAVLVFLSSAISSNGQSPEFPAVDNSRVMAKYGFDVGKPGLMKEIDSRDEYKESGIRESRSVSEDDKLATVTRDRQGIYPLFDSYMLAFLLDPLTEKIAEEVRAGAAGKDQIAANIAGWARQNLAHTQQVAAFKGQPGSDPWGAYGNGEPVFKKAIPAEMLAKSMYTGNITGKCEALPSLIAAVFVLNGASPDDVVILRLATHNVGLVRFAGVLYLVNNQSVAPVDERRKQWLETQPYQGFSSYAISIYRDFGFGSHEFRLNQDFLRDGGGSLLETFLKETGTRGRLGKGQSIDPNAVTSRDRAFSLVFSDPDAQGLAKDFTLARYADQSLYVKDPDIYLKASIRAPRTMELAKTLKNKESIFDWIRTNVAYGSIFEDSSERIMTADEVIVFRKGSLKDQAVLAFSLLKLRGYKPQIEITQYDAFVTVDHEIYDAKTWEMAPSIDGAVLLKLNL